MQLFNSQRLYHLHGILERSVMAVKRKAIKVAAGKK